MRLHRLRLTSRRSRCGCGVYRQPNYKSRATVRRELRDYLAIMLSHDLLADVESETQTGAMVVGMRLIKSLKD